MEIFQELIERWMEEFGRAVEMFTGEKPTLTSLAAPEISETEISAHTWWKQQVNGESSFPMWAGATETIWSALGDAPDGQSTFFEMLSQANQGTVAAMSAGCAVPLQCQDGISEAPVVPTQDESPLLSAQIKIVFRGAEIGIILLLVDPVAVTVFSLAESHNSGGAAERESAPVPAANPAMLSRLLDLQLPVSVRLGSARITIKDTLKLMSGSVVELDRQVGDHVEIMVHGALVAKGEIVSVKGNYGVRIREVISRQDRAALQEVA